MKEQSLTSTGQNPKIITPNKELVGVKKSEKTEVTNEKAKLPQPTGWRLLVLPFKMNELEELGRVDAEHAYTKKGKHNLKEEKKRIVRNISSRGAAKRGHGKEIK